MNTTPPDTPLPADPGAGSGPRVSRDDVRQLGRLRRTVGGDRRIAGVAGGLGRHLDIDPVILRVAFVVLALFGGSGLMLYGALWLLVPEDGEDRAPIHVDERSRSVALVGVAVVAALALLGDSWGVFGFPWPAALVALVVIVLVVNHQSRRSGTTAGPAGPAAAQAGGAVSLSKHQRTDDPLAPDPVVADFSYRVDQGPPPAPRRRRDSRRRGPILFGYTLALIALGAGILGMVDVAGVDVPGSAYPALALGVCAAMLLLGAFWGRAGGIILLGLVSALVTLAGTASERWDSESVRETPATSSAVDSRYWQGAGELVLDLSQVSDPEELDGRTVRVEGGIGRLEVILPETLDVRWSGRVDGPGNLVPPGRRAFDGDDGIDLYRDGVVDVDDEAGTLDLDVSLGVGEIVIRTP